jgi:hypothetical protein
MDNMPLLHEPGFTEKHPDVVKYNQIIYFKNFDFSVNSILSKDSGWNISPFNDIFEKEMGEQFTKNRADILTILEEKKGQTPDIIKTGIYSMVIPINWENTYNKFLQIKL